MRALFSSKSATTRPSETQQLSAPLLAIGERKADARQHVEARTEKGDLGRKDRELSFGLVLGVRATRVSHDADDITTTEVLVLLLERDAILLGQLRLAYHLELGANAHGISRSADICCGCSV